jgi:hypothetical protein
MKLRKFPIDVGVFPAFLHVLSMRIILFYLTHAKKQTLYFFFMKAAFVVSIVFRKYLDSRIVYKSFFESCKLVQYFQRYSLCNIKHFNILRLQKWRKQRLFF